MAGTIVHFGLDHSSRLSVFSSAGFSVNDCGCSLDEFLAVLERNQGVVAVVVSDCRDKAAEAVVIARDRCPAPLILFESPVSQYDSSQFDLVIPALTPPQSWLSSIAATIERSRTLGD